MQCDFGYDASDHFRRLDSIPDTFPINRKHNDELSVHVRVSVSANFVETVSGELLLFMKFHARNFLLNFLVHIISV